MLAARRVSVAARVPRGPWRAEPKLPFHAKSLYCSSSPLAATNGCLQLVLASQTSLQTHFDVISRRFFSQLPGPQLPVMTKEEVAKSNDYRTILECAPDDADLARVVFKDIQDDGGTTLTRFLASTIASALLKAGSLGESVEVLELAWDRGVQVHPNVYGSVFGTCAREKEYDCVLRVWDAKAAGDHEHIPWQYTSALVAAVHLKQKGRVFGILDEMKANGVKDDKMGGLVLGAACQTKQHELACEILDYMHASGIDCATAYQNTSRLAYKLGEYDFVLELLGMMKKHGMDPTQQYQRLIMLLHKDRLHDDVVSAFTAMRRAECVCGEHAYGNVVNSAIRVKNRDVLFSVLDDMKANASNLPKTGTAVFCHTMRAAIWTNQLELVLDLFDTMDQAGVDASAAYVSAIRSAFQAKQYNFVFDILRKMAENGQDAKEVYSNIVMSFSKVGCYDHVLRAFKTMRELGYEHEDVHCMAAVRAAIKLDRVDDVVAISNGLGITASTRLYSTALRMARAANKQALVDNILDHIKKSKTKKTTPEDLATSGKKPSIAAKKRSTATKKPTAADASSDDVGAVPAILAEYLEKIPNTVDAHSMALQAADASNGTQELVPEILDHLLKVAEDPSAVYWIILRNANSAKRHGLVMTIADHAAKNGVKLRRHTCKIILESYSSLNDLGIALDASRMLIRTRIATAEDTVFPLIKCAAKLDEWDTVVDIMASLENEGFKPTMAMYTVALGECPKRGHLDRAVDIYNAMPESLRAQLTGTALRVVVRAHARSESKELQQRAMDIIDDFRHSLSPQQYKSMQENVRTIQEEVAGKASVTPEATAKPADGSTAEDTPSKGIMGYFLSLFKR